MGKERSTRQASKDQVNFECNTLEALLPDELKCAGKNFWKVLRNFTYIPKVGGQANEIRHQFGPLKAFAAGIIKSFQYGKPMLELHGTACPSYLPFTSGQTETRIAVDSHKKEALYGLSQLTHQLDPFYGRFINGLSIHTPSPADIDCDFSGHMSLLTTENGRSQLQQHWQKMKELEKMIGGLNITVDLPYLTANFSMAKAIKWWESSKDISDAFIKFMTSHYAHDAYFQWGSKPEDVFFGLYLGTVVAYGNHESVFDLDNPDRVKLYLNFEENNGPETFAGSLTGVDVRHILAEYGYHLPLLAAYPWLRTPWLEN